MFTREKNITHAVTNFGSEIKWRLPGDTDFLRRILICQSEAMFGQLY